MVRAVIVSCALAFAATAAAAPPPSDGFVESTRFPLRVHYTNAVGPTVARQGLAIAESAYESLFVTMGFPEPTTLDDADQPTPGIRLYFDPDLGNYAEPITDNPATPRSD